MFINTSQIIGQMIMTATTNITGSIILTLGMVILILFAIAVMFSIPLEFTAIIVFPLLLSYIAYYGEYLAIGTVFIIYITLILTRRFIFR